MYVFPTHLASIDLTGGDSGHAWKFRYSASCLSISIQHIFTTRAPNYKALLDLDKKIRKFPVAHHLLSPIETSEPGRAWSSNRVHALQQYCVVCERESSKYGIVSQCVLK